MMEEEDFGVSALDPLGPVLRARGRVHITRRPCQGQLTPGIGEKSQKNEAFSFEKESGGKPTSPTLRLLNLLDNSSLKAIRR